MKLFIAMFFLGLNAEAFTHVSAHDSPWEFPNEICIYNLNSSGQWVESVGWRFAVNTPAGDEFMEVDTATYDSTAPGRAMCTSYGILKPDIFTITTYSFDTADFKIESGVCKPKTTGHFTVDSQVEVVPAYGASLDQQVQMNAGSYRYINYFLTAEEKVSWLKHPDLADQKCLSLLPGSIPKPTTQPLRSEQLQL